MGCINLKERFGRKYRVVYEESYYAQYGPGARTEDPWYMVIPCQLGHVYPFGGSMLAATTNKSGPVAKRLKSLSFVTVHQDGSDGVTVLFNVVHFPEIARIMRPRVRRQVSLEQRSKLIDQLQRARKDGPQKPVDGPGAARVCVQRSFLV